MNVSSFMFINYIDVRNEIFHYLAITYLCIFKFCISKCKFGVKGLFLTT